MEKKKKMSNNMSKENDMQIEVLENENVDISIQNSSQFPRNPSLPKESDFSNEKIVKEKQGKTSKKDISLNDINVNNISINNIQNSLNNINTNSFNNISTSFNNINSSMNNINHSYQQNTSINNQENILKGKEESLQQVVRVNLSDLKKNPLPIMNDQRFVILINKINI